MGVVVIFVVVLVALEPTTKRPGFTLREVPQPPRLCGRGPNSVSECVTHFVSIDEPQEARDDRQPAAGVVGHHRSLAGKSGCWASAVGT